MEEVDMHAKQTLVADVMAAVPIVVHVDASLEEADGMIRSTYLKFIPVVDGDGALVGVIRDADLVAFRFARSQSAEEMTSRNETTNDAPPDHRHSR
jgi:Mg/Co/Ni transporter MgtE